MKYLLVVLTFSAGLGAGCVVFRGNDKPGVIVPPQTSKSEPSNATVSDELSAHVPAEEKGIYIRLKRAWELRRNYRSGVHIGRPPTEAVIHDIASLRTYLDRIEKELAEEAKIRCKGCTPGVALYFGESYKADYALETDGKYAYLLEKNNTVFLMPFYFKEKDSMISFKYVEEGSTITSGTRPIKIIDKNNYWAPLDGYEGGVNWKAQKITPGFKRFLKATEGFDLGHTKP